MRRWCGDFIPGTSRDVLLWRRYMASPLLYYKGGWEFLEKMVRRKQWGTRAKPSGSKRSGGGGILTDG